MYDAVNAICGYPFTAYAVKPDVQIPALPEAAVAAAAHDVLVALYPAQAATLNQQYADYLGAIPGHHEGKINGIAVGQQTAAGSLRFVANGWLERLAWVDSTCPGIWHLAAEHHIHQASLPGRHAMGFVSVTPLDDDQSVAISGSGTAGA